MLCDRKGAWGKRSTLVINAKGGRGISPFSCLLGLLVKSAFPMGLWHFLPLHSYCVINTSRKGLKTNGDKGKYLKKKKKGVADNDYLAMATV